jgi:hypothetical protein
MAAEFTNCRVGKKRAHVSLDEKEWKKQEREQQTNTRTINEIMEVVELMMRLRWKIVRSSPKWKFLGVRKIVNQ